MPLELYHLHLSQSERIVWLLEEMCIPYELTVFDRDPITALSPPELKALVCRPHILDENFGSSTGRSDMAYPALAPGRYVAVSPRH